ncbi:kinase-like domain-containing protein [Gautieria morchelliformis]|nr:kinase-like domain-containing protein [Gautieria morchelliformis]
MRVLCSTDATFWEPTPGQTETTIAGIPLTFYEGLITYILEVEIAQYLENHCCDTFAPCVVLRKAMQICLPHLSVCKMWRQITSTILKQDKYSILAPDWTSPSDLEFDISSDYALQRSLRGRYRAYIVIEESIDKSVLKAYDYGGHDGCHGKVKVVLKVSNRRELFENEQAVYKWLGATTTCVSDVPQLYFADKYSPEDPYYGLVLFMLGPDLETLLSKCRNKRFTTRMTLGVAIQLIGIYERFHAQGLLHCNAKPGNFAIGPDIPGQNNRIFMFDFEFSLHTQPKSTGLGKDPIQGWNGLYKPIGFYSGVTPSRRDDLEGLGYVFSYLERGGLPWGPFPGDEKTWCQKVATPTATLFDGMDPAYKAYFNDVKALAWGEFPDYGKLSGRFVEAWERRGYGDTPQDIDWWSEFKLRTD